MAALSPAPPLFATPEPIRALIPPYMQERLLAHYERLARQERGEGTKYLVESQRYSNAAMKAEMGRRLIMAATAPLLDESASTGPSAREVCNALDPKATKVVLSTRRPATGVAAPQEHTLFGNMEKIDTFFQSTFKIYCVNNGSKLMLAYTQHPDVINNAFWNSELECVLFGRVDSKIYRPFTTHLGITTHEFGHAVTQYYSEGLRYFGQSGAIDESLSDVYATLLKHTLSPTVGGRYEDWSFGEGVIVNPREKGTALRSLSHPGTAFRDHPVLGSDAQVGHMNEYVRTSEDHGGVHLNSGIPNRAFYLAATKIADVAHVRAGNIWFRAMRSCSRADDFATFGNRTIRAAQDLGLDEGVVNAVGQAWMEVGVNLKDSPRISALPDITSTKPTTYNNWEWYVKMGGAALVAGLFVMKLGEKYTRASK